MSITELNKISNYSFRRRHDSGELDVFEAAGYFSGVHENPDDYKMIHIFPHKSMREEIQRPERMRLDSMIRNPIPPQNHAMHQKKIKEMIKKSKQPSSPGGGRLAGFLNLLFSHASSKKCKSKSIGAITDLEQATPLHGGRRIGRISKIYSRNPNVDTADAVDSKSMHSCSSSGFRTPPLRFSDVPTKPDDEFVRFFYPKNGGNLKAKSLHDAFYFDKISTDYFALSVEEKLRINIKNSAVNWIDDDREYPSEQKGFSKFSDDADDGADTDSSSDLFDLPNHDLDVYGNGLPVYQTTLMNNIRTRRGGSLV